MTTEVVDKSIYDAISEEDMPALLRFIEQGEAEDVEDGNWTPLLCAVDENNIEAVRLLIKAGADVDTRYESTTSSNLHIDGSDDTWCNPLSLAIYRENLEIAELLIEHMAEVNCDIYTCTYDCISGSQIIDSRTCLQMAVEMKNAALQKLLIEAGADIDEPNANDDTLMTLAIKKGDLKRVKALIEWGADCGQVCETNWSGSGILFTLALESYIDDKSEDRLSILETLLEAGGLTTPYFNGNDSIMDWVLESSDHKLISLFGLEVIQSHIEELREEIRELGEELKQYESFNPRSLLAITDSRFVPPKKCDIQAIFELVRQKYSSSDICYFMHANKNTLGSWLDGHEPIPYPAWYLMIKIAFPDSGQIPAPV